MTDSYNQLRVPLDNIIVLPNGTIMDNFGRDIPQYTIGKGKKTYNAVCIHGVQELVHRLVATIYVPNPMGYNLVHHKDGNRFNNNYSNLQWVSYSEHGKIHGTNNAPIYVYKEGVCVGLFPSHTECAKVLGISLRSTYNKTCKGYEFYTEPKEGA